VRLLHVSDWHIGRQIGRHARDAEFDAVLDEIGQIARDAQPDLIVHSGDLFDVYSPAVADLRRAVGALRELSAVAPVLVVRGNHDSPNLLRFLDGMQNGFGLRPAELRRIAFADTARAPEDGGVLEYPAAGGEQTIRIAALPFVHQNRFAEGFAAPATATRDYAQQLRVMQSRLADGLEAGSRPDRDVLVFAAHMFVEGAQPSYSERRVDLDEAYASGSDALPKVAYGALGHIHKPQPVAGTGNRFPAHYAGSPLQLDFGEAGETKSVVVVQADPGRPTKVEPVKLAAGRRLVAVEGTLEQIAKRADRIGDAYVKVLVDTEEPARFLAEAVMSTLPKATVVAVEERCAARIVSVLTRAQEQGADQEPQIPDLFRDYLRTLKGGNFDAERVLDTFTDMLGAVEREEPGPCCEEDALRAALALEPGGANGAAG
jgi:exonuclease SbcD